MVANPITGAIESGRGPDSPLFSAVGRLGILDLGFHMLSASAADVKLNAMRMTQRGAIRAILVEVVEATADTDADGTFTVEINGSAITGGVVTIADASAGATAAITPGKTLQGTAITAGNKFDANDYIDVAWAITNAFADGLVRVYLVVEYGIN